MRIGIDLDNTLADYRQPLLRLCEEWGFDPPPGNPKVAFRDWLRGTDREEEWTRLQGRLYGPLMAEAELWTGAGHFLERASLRGDPCVIVSHRTPRPVVGPPHDLHGAARSWLMRVGLGGLKAYLEETRDAKLRRISLLGLDVFIDDLPEVLMGSGFPPTTRRLLFDPAGSHVPPCGVVRVGSWAEMEEVLWGA